MTQRVTVSLPDDVAQRLAQEPNASAFVAEAVRQQMAREQGRQLLAEQGFQITEEGLARARARLAEADQQWTPERRQQFRKQIGRPAGRRVA
jgi:parvulin-like peptidyl-prolyl isomerase